MAWPFISGVCGVRPLARELLSLAIVTPRAIFTVLGVVMVLATSAFADLPCQPEVAPPLLLTVDAVLDDVAGTLIQNGVSVLFVGALAVVGLPWVMAGAVMALVHLVRKR